MHIDTPDFVLYKSDNFQLVQTWKPLKLKHINKLERILTKHFFENHFDNYQMFQRTSINLKSTYLNEFTIKSKLPIKFYFNNEFDISDFSVRQQITTIINLLKTVYNIELLNA